MPKFTRRPARSLLTEEVTPSEAIVRVLEQAGIDMVFGIPGGNTGVLYNALYDHKSTIRAVLVREESRAGVMAEVYGRLTGKPGVTIAQAAFMVHVSMGAIEAHLSSSPMLILTDLSDHSPYSSAWSVSIWRWGVWVMGCETDVLRFHQTNVCCHKWHSCRAVYADGDQACTYG